MAGTAAVLAAGLGACAAAGAISVVGTPMAATCGVVAAGQGVVAVVAQGMDYFGAPWCDGDEWVLPRP